MFYDRFKQLCDQKGVSCNRAALEIGLSNATPTKWKKTGATPVGDTLNKIADYFGVSVDYLLGTEQKEKPTVKDDGPDGDSDFRELIQFYNNATAAERRYLMRQIEIVKQLRDETEKNDL